MPVINPDSMVAKCHPGYTKAFGHHLPVYEPESSVLDQNIQMLSKAQKKAAKLWKKCEASKGQPTEFAKARWAYLTSLMALRAAMVKANARRPLKDRLSPQEIIDRSTEYKVLIKLSEPAKVVKVPKSSGMGFRKITDFGPVARAAQRMAMALIRLTYQPAPFQFTREGVHAAIKRAVTLITEKGYQYVAELDIKSHYDSFETQMLEGALPLPEKAVREIVMAQSAKWDTQQVPPFLDDHMLLPTPHGIPQGSAASSAVAEWSVSQLKMIKSTDVTLINYADNFFLFAKSPCALSLALEALRLAVAKLPGGVFTTHPEKGHPEIMKRASEGFNMLGCRIVAAEDGADVFPTETSQQSLLGRFEIEDQSTRSLLQAAKIEDDAILRLEGVQRFLRLRSYASSWLAAHAMCSDLKVFKEDVDYSLASILNLFEISLDELEAASDPSTEMQYFPQSSISSS